MNPINSSLPPPIHLSITHPSLTRLDGRDEGLREEVEQLEPERRKDNGDLVTASFWGSFSKVLIVVQRIESF